MLRYTRDSRGKETVMADARVPLLRERLGLAAEPNSNYNAAVAMAVGKFQKANGIQVTGQLNGPTIEALNPPTRAKKLDAILATMERWRWMPRDLGKTHVELNIPDYFVRVFNNGEKVWQTRTVVGKPGHETPLLTETMKFITLNPTWNVPQSIIYNELLPIYETSDPQIFERQGLKMERDRDGNIRVFQPPGERNALGQIRFNFPNKFLVYQHDTPEKNYFNHDKRAYSHGCQRVQDPLKYAEVLLSYASPKSELHRGRHQADARRRGEAARLPQPDPGPPDVPDRVRRRGRQAGIPRGHLRPRRQADVDPPGQRAAGRRRRHRAAGRPEFQADAEQGQKLRSAAGGGGGSPFALFEQLFR